MTIHHFPTFRLFFLFAVRQVYKRTQLRHQTPAILRLTCPVPLAPRPFFSGLHLLPFTMLSSGSSQSESDSEEQEYVVYEVEPSHEITQDGVRFNVQTVTPSTDRLQCLTEEQVSQKAQAIGSRCYDISQPTIEAHSLPANLVKYDGGDTSLVHIALYAFANHLPLVITPEDVWLAITTGAATHINHGGNAEKLREKFVSHKGKKDIIVQKDHLQMGYVPKKVWEDDFFNGFSDQIRENIGAAAHKLFAEPFSATTKSQKAAMDITLMAATKNYFEYTMLTFCGIPWIELRGSRQDWQGVCERTEKLSEFLLPEFAEAWLPHLLPILDEFVTAYDGEVNHEFWQRMCKRVQSSMSGRSDHISGWISNLYPYLTNERQNSTMKPWQEMKTEDGPEVFSFPDLISSVPVTWDYYGDLFPLHFHAGYVGMTQDADTLALASHIGWVVSHNPNEEEKRAAEERKKERLRREQEEWNMWLPGQYEE